RVLVGTGDAVDVERALRVVMADRTPQPGGLDQELEPLALLELGVAGGRQVAADGVGDGGVDVEGRGPGRPVARALLAPDRPPGEGRPGESELPRAVAGEVEGGVAPEQRVAR